MGASNRLRRSGQMAQQVSVAVNLSPIQFKSHALPATVRSVLSDAGLAAKRLELEITEGVLLSNDEHVHDMIDSLKEIGVKLALDDFGTGYSSLSYLLRVPFDKIKIDQSFVRGASDPGSRNAALIRAMVGLASDLKMQTTAEGVETQDELLLVRNLGCSLVQGYIFGKPMPAEEALELAAKARPVLPDAISPAREPRIRIIRAALLHHEGQVIGARLRNISSGGALVECRERIPVGARDPARLRRRRPGRRHRPLDQGHAIRRPVQGDVRPQAPPAGETRAQKCGGRAELPERRRGRAR